MPLYTLPDRLHTPYSRDGVVLYDHHSVWIPSRYMISFTRPCMVVTLSGERTISHAERTETSGVAGVELYPPGPVVSVALTADEGEPFRCLMAFAPAAEIATLLARHADDISPAQTFRRHLGPVSRLLPVARAIGNDLMGHGAGTPALDGSRFAQMLHILIAEGYGPDLKAWAATAADPPAIRLTKIMEAHWAEGLSLNEYAFLSGMSLSAFKRAFARTYRMPPGRWLAERRMAHAAHMLAAERRRPSEVWARLGFSSQTAFTQIFRRHFGVTPGQYRAARDGAESDSFRTARDMQAATPA